MKHFFEEKIFDENYFPGDKIREWKDNGEKIVFTNGCFDLLHRGHIHYLSTAARLGDILIVGINSDRSVRSIKGPGRPVKDQRNRSEILASLGMVDLVVIFDGDTPIDLIKKVVPDVLVKGGDWKTDEIVGGSFVQENGGNVVSLEFIEGESSSNIIERIIKNHEIT